MANTNLNIRTDKEVKEQAETIYAELGLNMTTAVNLFLRASIRASGIPFDLKLDMPNEETRRAIEEGHQIARDPKVPAYESVDDLKAALDL